MSENKLLFLKFKAKVKLEVVMDWKKIGIYIYALFYRELNRVPVIVPGAFVFLLTKNKNKPPKTKKQRTHIRRVLLSFPFYR